MAKHNKKPNTWHQGAKNNNKNNNQTLHVAPRDKKNKKAKNNQT